MQITAEQIEDIRNQFQPVEGSKLATALNRTEAALNRYQALETRAAVIRGQAARADSFMSQLVNHAIDLTAIDDLLQMTKNAQATQTAVSAIEATARTQIQEARQNYENESGRLNNLAKLLYEAKRDQARQPGRLAHLLVKYAGHPPAKNGGVVDRARRRLQTV